MNISIIGAGNGGQAFAAYCASKGHKVCLYNRTISKIRKISNGFPIKLVGATNAESVIPIVTDNLEIAVKHAELILVVTTATAHHEIIRNILLT